MSVLQPGLQNNGLYLPYWFNAILLGTLANVLLFLGMNQLGTDIVIPDPPAIIVDFMQWQEPVRPAPAPQPLKKARPRTVKKQKPLVSRPVKPALQPVPEVKKQVQADKAVPLPEKVLSEASPVEKPVEQTPAAAPAREQFEETLPVPLPVFKATSLPRIAHLANLERFYPAIKRQQGIEATVKLEVLIDREGKPRKVTVIKSAGPEFDQAAIDAIMASSFIPANFEGRPGPVLWRFPVAFRLR